MELPFFLPTSFGQLTAVASIPDDGVIKGPAAVMIPGGANARTRVRVLRDTATDLAARGQAALRFDYPGAGLSPGERMSWKDRELAAVVVEACEWFLGETGQEEAAIAGTCIGGLVAFRVAALYDRIHRVAVVGVPLRRGRKRRTKPRIRAGIAGMDRIGPAVAARLARSSQAGWQPGDEWQPKLLEHLTTVAERAEIRFAYGANDRPYEDYQLLKETEELSEKTRERLSVDVLPEKSLGNLLDVEQHPWVRSVLTEALSATPKRVDV
jgi:pimeloyl-ACP methyl ester carboxylesterase